MRDVAVPSPADPEGYYATLGVGPLADRVEIRAAYTRLVKLLHPDFNPLDEAVWQFLRVNEAYRVLSDRKRRAAYDATLRAPTPSLLIDPEDPAPEPVVCCRCGKISAQPRYVVFHKVKSCLVGTKTSQIRGIFCRDCADRTAIRASTATWAAGWWGPTGPYHTLRALFANWRGGDKPRADNLWLLLHQARAFLAQGEDEIAAALARQAERFAKDDIDRQRINRLIGAVQDSERVLRDRWNKGGHAAFVQALPLAALALSVVLAIALVVDRDQTDIAAAEIVVRPAQAGEVRHVAVEMLKVRQGPSTGQPVVALLDRFTTVQVMDSVEGGEWARVLTPTGVTGYVPSRFLFGGSGSAPKSQWCADHRGAEPHSGEVLMRRTGGENLLTVTNDTADDIVVRLKTPTGPSLMSFFVGAKETAQINGVPGGSFRAVFATGSQYSRGCGIFLDDMRTYIAPTLEQVQARAGTKTLVIPPIGGAPGQSKPMSYEDYLDN